MDKQASTKHVSQKAKNTHIPHQCCARFFSSKCQPNVLR